jgi:hypothetical protein
MLTDNLYNKIALNIGVAHQARDDGVLGAGVCKSLKEALERFVGNEPIGPA